MFIDLHYLCKSWETSYRSSRGSSMGLSTITMHVGVLVNLFFNLKNHLGLLSFWVYLFFEWSHFKYFLYTTWYFHQQCVYFFLRFLPFCVSLLWGTIVKVFSCDCIYLLYIHSLSPSYKFLFMLYTCLQRIVNKFNNNPHIHLRKIVSKRKKNIELFCRPCSVTETIRGALTINFWVYCHAITDGHQGRSSPRFVWFVLSHFIKIFTHDSSINQLIIIISKI